MNDPAGSTERYNWHPAVHERYGEQLYFFLLRLRDPVRARVRDQVRDLLLRAAIEHACEYTVFGYWDALVRVWLTVPARRRLMLILDREDANVDEVRHLEASYVRYFWSSEAVDHSEDMHARVAANRADITTAIATFDDLDPALADRLLGAGLLLRPPTQTGGQVKFYVSLSPTGPTVSDRQATSALSAAIEKIGLTHQATLYSGTGNFANHLIKCVADSYASVLGITADLDSELGMLHVRPMTLLIANTDAHESDNVNDSAELAPSDQASLTLLKLGEAGEQTLRGLPRDQREALTRLLEEACTISDEGSELRDVLLAILAASAQNRPSELLARLAFLLEFEYVLGEYLKRAWGAAFQGGDWMKGLTTAFSELSDDRSAREIADPEKWTLGTCVQLAERSAAVNEQVRGRFIADMGPSWQNRLYQARDIRNKVTHGYLRRLGRVNDFAGEWGESLRHVFGIAEFYYDLRKIGGVYD